MGGRHVGHTTRAGRFGRTSLALLLLAMLSLGQHWRSPAAHAATFTVNSTADEHDAVPGNGVCAGATGRCTLRAAIEEANAFPGSDRVSVPSGTYTLTLGQLQTTSDISIEGAGIDATIVQAGTQPYSGTSRVFRLGVSSSGGPATGVSLGKLTVRHGAALSGDSGGGILVGAETKAVLDQVVVTGNHADRSGGGIITFGDLTLRNVVVSNNRAPGESTGEFTNGGGVRCVAPQEADISRVKLRIERSTIASNVAFTGGGVHANDCNVTISTSTISGNTATNSQGGGGLLFHELGTHVLTNVTISGNATTGLASNGSSRGGGGLMFRGDTASYNQPDSTLTMDHVTFFNNSSPTKTAGHNLVTIRPTRTEIRNSVLFHAQGYGINCTTAMTSRGGNIEFPGNTCFISPAASGPTDLTDTDPKLLPLANNGGPTMTHAIASGSRAIDRTSFSASTCQPTDQRGLPRGTDGNGDGRTGCDSGAFEVQSPPVGTFTLAPSTATVAVGQRHAAALTWTVTDGTWATLRSVQVRLREDGRDGGGSDEAHTALQFQWDQDTNTVRQVDPTTGRLGPPAALGSATVLESARAALYVKDSRSQGGGSASPNVTLTMSLAFKPPTKGRTSIVEVAATADGGASQGFAGAGTIVVDR